MDFLLDTNMPLAVLRVLIEASHRARHVRDLGLGNASDETIDQHVRAENTGIRDMARGKFRRLSSLEETNRNPPFSISLSESSNHPG
uniref:DUF5615 domain-containing protein n=1 Tax=Candidatus Kentrum sp. FW TaxID=2126338 RepID=A0A450SF85_9GAMM|nr:MAG: hypothetical protein BECKFW1821B_GA0114236_100930 [Candidatus Kentron sp. FW]